MLKKFKELGGRRIYLLLVGLLGLGLALSAVLTAVVALDVFQNSESVAPTVLETDDASEIDLTNIEFPDSVGQEPPFDSPADLEPVFVNPLFTNTYGEPVTVNNSPPTRIIIEDISVDAPVDTFGLASDTLPEVPEEGKTVAWYDFSTMPGQGSNAVLAGHVSWDKEPAVFWDLKELRNGSAIRLETDEGNELLYRVFAVYLIDPDDPDALRTMDPSSLDMITLISCGGRWQPDAGAAQRGSYSDRLVVQASLQFVNGVRYDMSSGPSFIGF